MTLHCSEFTSRCPITGQPDFGEITIVYVPAGCIVETKSLKLFLMRYRDRGVFNEQLVAEMADALFLQIKPKQLSVTGSFNSRGGISITVMASRGDGVASGLAGDA